MIERQIDATTGEILWSDSDTAALCAAESAIASGFDSFIEVGSQLLLVRDQRLYRRDYSSFEHYLDARWHISKARAYQIISAGTMSTIGGHDLANERQYRALSALHDPADRSIAVSLAYAAADRLGQRVTAALIEDAVKVVEEIKTTGAVELDATIEAPTAKVVLLHEERAASYIAAANARKEEREGTLSFYLANARCRVIGVDGRRVILELDSDTQASDIKAAWLGARAVGLVLRLVGRNAL